MVHKVRTGLPYEHLVLLQRLCKRHDTCAAGKTDTQNQAQIFGGLVAYGFAHGASTYGFSIAPWKAIFVFTGVLTSIAGIVFLIVMPDNQLNARFLTKEERVLAVQRIKINEQGIGNKHFKWYQMKEAFLDPMVWAFVFFALVADIPNGGITNFFSQLIVSFGYTPEQSLLYGTPGGAVEIVSLLVCGYLGDRFGNRLLISTSGLMLAILGVILIVAVPLDMPAGRLVGYYLTQVRVVQKTWRAPNEMLTRTGPNQAGPTPFVALLSLISTNIAGGYLTPLLQPLHHYLTARKAGPRKLLWQRCILLHIALEI